MNQTYTMKEMRSEERPYEKCLQNGAASLSDAELLAVILRSGIQGKNSLELAKRLSQAKAKERLSFTLPSSIADYYMEEMRHQKQEHMKLLMLNTKSKLIGETNISKGTVNAALVSPRELFIEALDKEAVSIILLHNHPSGDPAPSTNDILLTKRVKDAGALIGVELLDHIIIGNNCYMSFSESGLI